MYHKSRGRGRRSEEHDQEGRELGLGADWGQKCRLKGRLTNGRAGQGRAGQGRAGQGRAGSIDGAQGTEQWFLLKGSFRLVVSDVSAVQEKLGTSQGRVGGGGEGGYCQAEQ